MILALILTYLTPVSTNVPSFLLYLLELLMLSLTSHSSSLQFYLPFSSKFLLSSIKCNHYYHFVQQDESNLELYLFTLLLILVAFEHLLVVEIFVAHDSWWYQAAKDYFYFNFLNHIDSFTAF